LERVDALTRQPLSMVYTIPLSPQSKLLKYTKKEINIKDILTVAIKGIAQPPRDCIAPLPWRCLAAFGDAVQSLVIYDLLFATDPVQGKLFTLY